MGEFNLFNTHAPGNAMGFMHEDNDAWHAKELAGGESGGIVKIVPHFEERTFACDGRGIRVNTYLEFIDAFGRRLPFEPWSRSDEDFIFDLYKQYGARVKGLILNPDSRTMRLVVVR